jgi:hypothetical protein
MGNPEKVIAQVIALHSTTENEQPGNAARKIIAALEEAGYKIIQSQTDSTSA